jgi:TolC family type I secretion outer membrane protein
MGRISTDWEGQFVAIMGILALFAWPFRLAHAESADGIRLRNDTTLTFLTSIREPGADLIRSTGLVLLGELALSAQPAILVADARARADTEKLEQARGSLRPTVGGSVGYVRELANSGLAFPYSSYTGGLLVTLPLFRPQSDASIGQARYQETSSRSAVAEAEQDALFRVVDAFLNAAEADEEISLYDQERDVLLNQRRLNQRRMDGGVGTRVEVMETAARAEAILAQIEVVRNTYRSQLAELGRLSRSPVVGISRIQDRLPPKVVPDRVEDAITIARVKSSALARLDAALSAAKAGVEVQRAALRPTVDLVGNIDKTRLYSSGAANSIPSTGVGVQVAIPFYTGGVGESRIRENQALAEGAQAQFDDAANILDTELRKAYMDLDRTTEQWRIQVGVLATANESLEATRKAFDAGARTNIDLLNSQQLTFSTRRELLHARAGVLGAQVRILTLSSALDLGALARIATAFESDGIQSPVAQTGRIGH